MERTFFRYIFRYSLRQQVLLLLFTCASFPFLYGSLELPKLIVNEAIGGTGFPKEVFGTQFDQVAYLLLLCGAFLALVAIRFGFRYYVNVFKGQLGERMLRRLRYQLFSRTLRFPLPHFRKASQGEIIAMITAEVEPLGGFIGDALALPAFEGGTLLTILAFMFMQDWILGLAAISLFPVQVYVIPKLQAQVNELAKQRVRAVRKLSERIGEVVSGIEEIHANDTAELERADLTRWLGRIYDIRYQIYRKKFFIKFLNNIISNLTPFFFFSIGGYLVITGQLTFGALVAVLGAYKDVAGPWKELLNWYQQKENARIKYEQLIEQFMPPNMLPEELQTPPEGEVPHLRGQVVATNVSLVEDDGIRLVDAVSFSFGIEQMVALIGREGSGASEVAKLLARLLRPTAGRISIGGTDLATASEAVTGRRIGYVAQGGFFFHGSVRDNLYYGLRHQPLCVPAYTGEALAEFGRYLREAREAGNTESDLAGDWIDYADLGVEGPEQLLDWTAEVLQMVGVERDVFAFGLQGTFDPQSRPDLAARFLEARAKLRDRLEEKKYRDLVEPFDRDRFNTNMSVAENLLFGTPIGPVFDFEHIAENPYVLSILDQQQLTEKFVHMGLQVARLMVELFQDVEPGDELFERFSFISVEALPDYQAVVRRAERTPLAQLSATDRTLLLSLPFKLVPARHRLGLFDKEAERRLLEARRAFADGLPEELRGAVAFFDPDAYNPAASVQDNILFGRLAYGRQQAQRVVVGLIGEVIDELALGRSVVEIGLGYQVGIAGSRLSQAQRQKLSIARAVLKKPDLLILNEALAALDPGSQAQITDNLFNHRKGRGITWVANETDDRSRFDRFFVMESGRIVEDGEGRTADQTETGFEPSAAPQ